MVTSQWALDPKNPKNIGEGAGEAEAGDEEVSDAAAVSEQPQAATVETAQVRLRASFNSLRESEV